jgi:hypothetical protein
MWKNCVLLTAEQGEFLIRALIYYAAKPPEVARFMIFDSIGGNLHSVSPEASMEMLVEHLVKRIKEDIPKLSNLKNRVVGCAYEVKLFCKSWSNQTGIQNMLKTTRSL